MTSVCLPFPDVNWSRAGYAARNGMTAVSARNSSVPIASLQFQCNF